MKIKCIIYPYMQLRPSKNGLDTDGNTKICCHGFILALFQSTTANKINSEQYPRLKEVIPGMPNGISHSSI